MSGVGLGVLFNGCLALDWGALSIIVWRRIGDPFNDCLASDWGRLDLGPVVVATMVVGTPVAFSLVSPVMVWRNISWVAAPFGYSEGLLQYVASVYVVSMPDD